jgi:hypothetical protein
MAKFGLFQKNGTECISIYNSTHESLRYKLDGYYLAKKYFIAIKRLPEEEFDKLFEVKRIPNFFPKK